MILAPLQTFFLPVTQPSSGKKERRAKKQTNTNMSNVLIYYFRSKRGESFKESKDEEFWVQVLKRSNSIEILEGKIFAENDQVRSKGKKKLQQKIWSEHYE